MNPKLRKTLCFLIPLLLAAETCYAHGINTIWHAAIMYSFILIVTFILPILAQAVVLRIFVYTQFPISLLHSLILHIVSKGVISSLQEFQCSLIYLYLDVFIFLVNTILAVLSVYYAGQIPSHIISSDRIRPVVVTGIRLRLDAAWKGILVAAASYLIYFRWRNQ